MEQGRIDQEKLKQHQDQHQPPSQRMKPPEAAQNHQPPPPQKCPRCDSSNTKFCYYNNYSLSQPRYFCKACRRYWTHGGTLRNVPVGGGCRKSKRPKSSIPSSSTTEISRTQSFPPAISPQNLTGMNPGQGIRPLPPVISSMGNTFYSGGSFLSSLAAMQSLPAGINQGGAALNLGGGSSQYDALLQGVSIPSLKPQPPHQFQVQNEYFSSQQSLSIPSRPLTSWTQSFIHRGPVTTSSAASSSFWSGAAAADGGDNQAGSSFNPNHWPDNHPGFDPSQ